MRRRRKVAAITIVLYHLSGRASLFDYRHGRLDPPLGADALTQGSGALAHGSVRHRLVYCRSEIVHRQPPARDRRRADA